MIRAALLAALLMALPGPAAAQLGSFAFPADQPPAAPEPTPRRTTGEAFYPAHAAQVRGFTSSDQWQIPHYFERVRIDQTRARASRKKMERGLPDGMVRPVEPGDMLRADAMGTRLPATLERDLARLPPDLGRRIIGHDVALVRLSTGQVVDVIKEAVR